MQAHIIGSTSDAHLRNALAYIRLFKQTERPITLRESARDLCLIHLSRALVAAKLQPSTRMLHIKRAFIAQAIEAARSFAL